MIFHRHVWKKIESTEQPSPIEMLRKAGVTSLKGFQVDPIATRPIIVTYHCDGCGADKVVRV